MRWVLIISMLLTTVVCGDEEQYFLFDFKGTVEVREFSSDEWRKVNDLLVLESETTVRTGNQSEVRIKGHDGDIFTLPSISQIDVSDLRKMDRNQIIMELTSMEMLKLPPSKRNPKTETGLILHGSKVEEEKCENSPAVEKFIQTEINGAMALYHQGYMGGFILKWTRLMTNFPGADLAVGRKALIESYRKFNMTARLNNLLENNLSK